MSTQCINKSRNPNSIHPIQFAVFITSIIQIKPIHGIKGISIKTVGDRV